MPNFTFLSNPLSAKIFLNKDGELHHCDVSALPSIFNGPFSMDNFYSRLPSKYAIRTEELHKIFCALINSNEIVFDYLSRSYSQVNYLFFEGAGNQKMVCLEQAKSTVDCITKQKLLLLEVQFIQVPYHTPIIPAHLSFSDETLPAFHYVKQLVLASMRKSYRKRIGINPKLIKVGQAYFSFQAPPSRKEVACKLQIPEGTLQGYYKDIVKIAAGFSSYFRKSTPFSMEFLRGETLFGASIAPYY